MLSFYRGAIESILSSCITRWFRSCTASDRKTLQRIVNTAERIIGASLPSLLDLYKTRLTRRALSIVSDPTHPSTCLFTLLPSGRRFHSLRSSTTRLKNSFFHQAVWRMNSLPSLSPLSPLDYNSPHTLRHSNPAPDTFYAAFEQSGNNILHILCTILH